ncbi:MAG: VWA domain-containing protein [Halobacteriales archaeon]
MQGTIAAADVLVGIGGLPEISGLFGASDAGFERPLALLGIPIGIVILWALIFRRTAPSTTGQRPRLGLFGSRLLIATCLIVAAAGPYTVTTQATTGDPRVTLLVDQSASMAVTESVAEDLETGIEREGVTVSRSVIAQGNTSRIGDGVIANLEAGGSLVVVSDGQVTDGEQLSAATELARSLNATVNAVRLDVSDPEHWITIDGPGKTSVDVTTRFFVTVGGVNELPGGTQIVVRVDGEPVTTAPVPDVGTLRVTHNFSTTGTHRITAQLRTDDRYLQNNVFRRTVRVVDQPRILYVSRGEYPLRTYLGQLYDVTTADRIPDDLSAYYAVVIQNVAAPALGNVSALQRFVIDGNGLVVAGGERAYEQGSYSNSPIASMLPVRLGQSTGERSRIVLAIDVSGSTEGGMRVQKALALDVLSQLGDRNVVGIVAFNNNAHLIAEPVTLEEGRADLKTKIKRLRSRGKTNIARGLQGAGQLLGEQGGTVILLSDGNDKPGPAAAVARNLGDRESRVISIGVGQQIKASLLRTIAAESGGTYFRADETNRLRLLFGGTQKQFQGKGLTIVNGNHFITSGVRLQTGLAQANEVSVRAGADYLVATGFGAPAMAAWRFGLGRVVAITAYGANSRLDGLLTRPDSLVVSKSVNWAIGDPQRKAGGVVELEDTRVGQQTRLVYVGADRPTIADGSVSKVGDRRYEAILTPSRRGFHSVLETDYAANYRREYAAFGLSPSLVDTVSATGGTVFEPTDTAAIAQAVTRQSTHVRETRQEWDWLLVLIALIAFLAEVTVRRLQRYRGTGRATL